MIGDGVIATNSHGDITRMNRVAEALTGWLFEDAENKKIENVFQIIHAKERTDLQNPFDVIMNMSTLSNMDEHILLIAKNGKEVPIHLIFRM